jgi:tetratricopeptide (TPR) repeat protein
MAASEMNNLEYINHLKYQKKYLLAAKYISEKNLLSDSSFVAEYVDLILDSYIITTNFKLFGLKDLSEEENIIDLRGKPGEYEIVCIDLEKMLYEKFNDSPNDPFINLAVGTYISRGFQCNCLQPEFFSSQSDTEFKYFNKAYQKGVFNYWSLFRLAFNSHMSGDYDNAIILYEKSLELKPDHIPSAYNLAIAYFNNEKLEKALYYSDKSLGKYNDAELDADTYHLNGSIHAELGNFDKAEKSLSQSLKLKLNHSEAFKTLLTLYRKTNLENKYVDTVYQFISNDFSNTYFFNQYINYFANNGMHSFDHATYKKLCSTKIEESQAGPFYFNLGKLADGIGDQENALKYLNKSLTAFSSIKNPPEGAIDALNILISQINKMEN